MKQLFFVFMVTAAAAVSQPTRVVSGTISGMLTGEDGTAITGATIRLHLTSPVTSKFMRQKTDWAAVTVTGGAFQFDALPEGSYTLCARVQNSTWLNPCEWNFPTPSAKISQQNPNTNIKIVLKRGAAVPIGIDDAGRLLAQHEGKTPGAGLLVSVSRPGLFFRLVPLVSQTAERREHQIVVPFNTALTLVVQPSFYTLNDARGVALSRAVSTKIPLLVAPGQQIAPVNLTITGVAR